MFGHPDYDSHEELLFAYDAASGLRALVAIHNSALGPAFGGCRMYPYADETQAIADVLRLSKGMTYKAAICSLPYGGGKSVIVGDPRRNKTPALLHAMGRLVESLSGRYIIADDVGTTLADLAVMRAATTHTAAATPAAQAPLPVTAYGVLMAITAAVRHTLGREDLTGLTVAVQGLGNVGMPLWLSARAGREALRRRPRPGARGAGRKRLRGECCRAGRHLRPSGRSVLALRPGCGLQRPHHPAPALPAG
ncbi:MAG: Glu/Leu/Phe/Val dehydrogenase dimerization domain-containing protein, partial [Rhodopila sp.]